MNPPAIAEMRKGIIANPNCTTMAAMPVLKRFRARLDPRGYNGAALLGLRGLVFKSHGSADAYAFEMALTRAYDAARNRLLDRVHLAVGAEELSGQVGVPPAKVEEVLVTLERARLVHRDAGGLAVGEPEKPTSTPIRWCATCSSVPPGGA